MTEIEQFVNETNTTIPGIEEYFESVQSENATGIGLNEAIEEISSLGPAIMGARELTGIVLIGIIAFALYRNNAGIDTWFTILPPSFFVLAQFGFLPFANAFIVISILAIAALITYGISQYIG